MAATFRYSGYAVANGYDVPLLVLFNGDEFGSGRVLNVINASVRPVKSQVATAYGTIVVKRITGSTGGSDVGIVKADTSSSDLPSQVSIKIDADVTESSVLASRLLLPIPASPFALRGPGNGPGSGLNPMSGFFYTSRGEGSTQNTLLAEGQGVAVMQQNSTPHPSGVFQLVATIKVGTAYYYINAGIYAREYPTASFVIMNGSGSGVTIELVSIEVNEIGSPTITTPAAGAPYISYKRVDGYLGGEEVTPVAMDTSNSLHSSTKLVRNRLHLDMIHYEVGSRLGIPSKYAYGYPSSNMILARSAGLIRQTLTHIADPMDVNLAAAFPASALKARVQDLDISGGVSDFKPIVLNPGEGLSVQSMNLTHYAAYYVEIEFTHVPPAPAASGGLKSFATVV